ncbi:MAG: hypothetical protein EKK57_01180 [Proteobacteria bacterium]|nr:MAG: hypothetical protein EKK57_01180 [Pseudomonadota bacterium]
MNEILNTRFIEDLVHNIGGHSLLKDTSTNKYITANTTHVKVYGFTQPSDITGYDIWELNNLMSRMWEDNAKQVNLFDKEVCYTKKTITHPRRVWLNANGYIWMHSLRKVPVTNTVNNVVAILSIGDDLTNTLTLKELYDYYLHFYIDKKIARRKFLEHVRIIQYFHEMPTDAELRVLIARSQNHVNKIVANNLNFQLSTVQFYINQLKQKIKDFDLVLEIMRLW